MTTQQLSPGDRVRVTSPSLTSHGKTGTVTYIDPEAADNDWPVNVKLDNDRLCSPTVPFDFDELEIINGEPA